MGNPEHWAAIEMTAVKGSYAGKNVGCFTVCFSGTTYSTFFKTIPAVSKVMVL